MGCSQDFCSIEVMGRGPGGFKGPGAISMLFDEDLFRVELTFKARGASTAKMMFFDENGEILDELPVDIELTDVYRFERENGDIRGIAITSDGGALAWHKFSLVGMCLHEF